MTALLQVFFEDEEKVVKYVKVAKDMGFEILPPDINRSEIGFTIDGERAIRFGLGSIKGLGEATINSIIHERSSHKKPVIKDEDGMEYIITEEEVDELMIKDDSVVIGAIDGGGIFMNIQDLMDRLPKRNLNRKSLMALCFSGAFDTFFEGTTMNRFDFMERIFTLRGEDPDEETHNGVSRYSDRLKLNKEREYLGIYVSGHVLQRIAEPTDWELLDDTMHFTSVVLNSAKVITTKKGDDMAFLTVDTLEGEQDLTLFPKQYETVKNLLIPGIIFKVGVKGSMNWQRNKKDYVIQNIVAQKRINKEIFDDLKQKEMS